MRWSEPSTACWGEVGTSLDVIEANDVASTDPIGRQLIRPDEPPHSVRGDAKSGGGLRDREISEGRGTINHRVITIVDDTLFGHRHQTERARAHAKLITSLALSRRVPASVHSCEPTRPHRSRS